MNSFSNGCHISVSVLADSFCAKWLDDKRNKVDGSAYKYFAMKDQRSLIAINLFPGSKNRRRPHFSGVFVFTQPKTITDRANMSVDWNGGTKAPKQNTGSCFTSDTRKSRQRFHFGLRFRRILPSAHGNLMILWPLFYKNRFSSPVSRWCVPTLKRDFCNQDTSQKFAQLPLSHPGCAHSVLRLMSARIIMPEMTEHR
jgi:hypothetical protein